MTPVGKAVKDERVAIFYRGIAHAGTVWKVKKDGTRIVKLDEEASNGALMVDCAGEKP